MQLTVERYESKLQERWDSFVMEHSVNGTFLQTRRFLNYHPKGRFEDSSLLVMNNGNILAVVPGCNVLDAGKRTFFSHKGSTFGGIVLAKQAYNIISLETLLPVLNDYFVECGYEKIILKNTSMLFSTRDMSLLDYELFKNGYDQYDELSFYINCRSLPEDILQVMTSSRRRDCRYSMKSGFRFERLTQDAQIGEFYRILEMNLQKFGTKPVHTLEELLEFKHARLPEIVDFYGVYLQDTLVAGTMLFRFGTRVLHTQYLAALVEYQKLFPMNFLDYQLILLAREQGYQYFSFGISTEENGKTLNTGLALFKEGFGTDYSVNRTYVKEFS